MKIALLVAYDGTGFRGFARQRNARTVQGVLEGSLSMLLRGPVAITGAGRTDAGVHAWGQVVSFEAPEGTRVEWVRARLNRLVGPQIGVRAATEVRESFDARFSARRREYEYRVHGGDAPDPFADRFAVWVAAPLDLRAMRAGAKAYVGEHDFSAFCRKGQGSLVRRVRSVRIVRDGDRLTFRVSGDSFCHQQVRSMVGLLLDVGRGKRQASDVAGVVASRDRSRSGTVAPARGLHLMRVRYRPDPFVRI